ncbi:hypothetical protein XENOCAPTIV_025359, partial [Xenoophorus captivus]
MKAISHEVCCVHGGAVCAFSRPSLMAALSPFLAGELNLLVFGLYSLDGAQSGAWL